jgi:hypothetical protein
MKRLKLPCKSDIVNDEAEVLITGEQTSEVVGPKPTEGELAKINKIIDDSVVQPFEQINSGKYTDKYQLIGRRTTKIAKTVC